MLFESADTAKKHESREPEGIDHFKATVRDWANSNQGGSADVAHRAAADLAAVQNGILPKAPEFVDSSSPQAKSPVSSNDDFSKKFDGMKSGDVKYGKNESLNFRIDSDGTQHRYSYNFGDQSSREEIVHPDKSTELITASKGTLDEQKWDATGNLRSDTYNSASTTDGKLNYSDQKNWLPDGKQVNDYKRWQTSDGEWHEAQQMNLADGTKISKKMDGDRTVTRTTNPDGSWDNIVQTANVDQVDLKTGKHFKTITIDRTSGK